MIPELAARLSAKGLDGPSKLRADGESTCFSACFSIEIDERATSDKEELEGEVVCFRKGLLRGCRGGVEGKRRAAVRSTLKASIFELGGCSIDIGLQVEGPMKALDDGAIA